MNFWIFITLLVILGIALLVTFKNREQNEGKAKLAMTGILGGIVVVVLLRIFTGGPPDPADLYDPAVDRGTGEGIARDVAEVAQGNRVGLIIDLSPAARRWRSIEEGFVRELEARGMEVIAKADPLRGLDPESPQVLIEEGVAPQAIEDLLDAHPDIEILVSAAGLPLLEPRQMAALLNDTEFYAFDPHPAALDWPELLTSNALQGIVTVPRDAHGNEPDGTPEEIYDAQYIFVTPENLREVSGRLRL